jgi:hypothetical protein
LTNMQHALPPGEELNNKIISSGARVTLTSHRPDDILSQQEPT